MTVVCALCKKPQTSMLADGEKAITDLIDILTKHVKYVHKVEFRELEEDLRDLQQLLTAAPAYLLLQEFGDIEDGRTSEAFKGTASDVEKAMQRLSELLFGPEEEGEGVEERPAGTAVGL